VGDHPCTTQTDPRALPVEAAGRNTAPAIAAAALITAQDNPDAVLLVLSSDYLIGDESASRRLRRSFRIAQRSSRSEIF